MKSIRRALVLGLELIAGTAIEQAPSDGVGLSHHQIVINIAFWAELTNTVVQMYVHKTATFICVLNRHLVASYDIHW